MEKLRDQRLIEYSSDHGTNLSFEKDRAYGFSWPQRNYRCSFCKKEFKSAQALGGHMNVHRRDRARMRLSPSWDSTNPNPNPSSPTSTPQFLPHRDKMVCHSSTLTAVTIPPSSASERDTMMTLCRGDGEKKKKKKGAMLELTSFTRSKDARVWKANEFVRLDLNLGLLQDAKEDLDLDLELRLGCS